MDPYRPWYYHYGVPPSGSRGHEFPDGDSRFSVNIYQQHITSSRNPLVSVPTSERREQVCSFFLFFLCVANEILTGNKTTIFVAIKV